MSARLEQASARSEQVPGLLVLSALLLSALLLGGCPPPSARAPAPVEEPPELSSSSEVPETLDGGPEVAEAAEEPEPLPTTCGSEMTIKDLKVCLPPGPYAKRLCGGVYPDVALGMFGKGTPWTRLWLAGEVEAWNASGGRTHPAKLVFDEEVMVLSRHAAASAGGIVMSGAGASYDVLRWDGTCVSVMEGELTTRRPPAPKHALVPFGHLEETTRHALLASAKVKATLESRDKACSSGSQVGRSCEDAGRAVTQAVAEFVRGGGSLPLPSHRP